MKKLTFLAALALFLIHPFQAVADLAPPATVEQFINGAGAPFQMTQLGTQLTKGKPHNITLTYDFDVDGGALGEHVLRGLDGSTSGTLPDNAIVQQGVIDVLTTLTSATNNSNLSVTMQTASDLKALTDISLLTSLQAMVPVDSAATMIKLTAARTVSLWVVSEGLTAGKLNILLRYILSD